MSYVNRLETNTTGMTERWVVELFESDIRKSELKEVEKYGSYIFQQDEQEGTCYCFKDIECAKAFVEKHPAYISNSHYGYRVEEWSLYREIWTPFDEDDPEDNTGNWGFDFDNDEIISRFTYEDFRKLSENEDDE